MGHMRRWLVAGLLGCLLALGGAAARPPASAVGSGPVANFDPGGGGSGGGSGGG